MREPNRGWHPGLKEDLLHIFAHTRDLWKELEGQRIFLTGGTGFFGCWLLESFCFANKQLALNARAVVLSRDPKRFAAKALHLAEDPAVELFPGDLRSGYFPSGNFSYVIHAALDDSSSAEFSANTVNGTQRTIDFAVRCGAQRYLFTSSGAVYGNQPPHISHIPEDYGEEPMANAMRTEYGEAKRLSEGLCMAAHVEHRLKAVIARCFAFVGPYLPLRANFAIGNFIDDALYRQTIHVNGDGRPRRSYLYAADLAIWLWTILLRGVPGRVYNVGSNEDLMIADLAKTVRDVVNPDAAITIAQPISAHLSPRYVPAIERARTELGLRPWIDLREGIKRTAEWHRVVAAHK